MSGFWNMRSYMRRVMASPCVSSAGTVALTRSMVLSLRAVAISSPLKPVQRQSFVSAYKSHARFGKALTEATTHLVRSGLDDFRGGVYGATPVPQVRAPDGGLELAISAEIQPPFE